MNSPKSPPRSKSKLFINQICYLLISFNVGISSITSLATNYLFKDKFKINPATTTQILFITNLPWLLKPILGIITDFIPICGYRRKVYLILTGVINSLCWVLMSYFTNSIANVTILLTVVNCTLSMSTVIGQATVVELSKEKGNDSKNLISLYSFFKFVGVLCSSFFKGFLVEKFSIRVVFVVASILPLVLFVSGVMLVEKRYGYLEKEEKEEKLINTNEKKKEDSLFHKLIVFYCQKKILIPTSFIIFLLWAPPGYEQPLFYFNSEVLHFTPKDFGYLFLCSTIVSLIIIQIYKRFLLKLEFSIIVSFARIGYFLSILVHYSIIQRYNLKYGIPDFYAMMLGNSLQNSMRELTLLPVFSLAVSLCPKNLEGTIYSVFMSAITLGSQFGAVTGSFLTNYLSITKGNYDNLWILIKYLLCITLLPLPILCILPKDYFNFEKKKSEDAEKGTELEDKPTDDSGK